MKSLIKTLLREGLLSEGVVTQSQLNNLERELDGVFKSVGVDIEFTRHFFDRVNDERNGRDITIDELRGIFKEVYSEYKNRLKKYGDGFVGVFKNPPTAINIPFILNWDSKNKELDLVTKTIMRKKNFMSDTPILPVGSKNKTNNEPKDKFKKLKLSNNQVIRYYELSNRFETLDGTPIEIDDIFDTLPPEMQDMVLTNMDESKKSMVENDDDDYKGSHSAPDSDSDSMDDLMNTFGDDVYTPNCARYFGHGGGADDAFSCSIIRTAKGNPNKKIKIYRAVPKGVTKINNGDWVTISPKYAKQHGSSYLDGYSILSMVVFAKDLYTDGNSIHEWGYNPQ